MARNDSSASASRASSTNLSSQQTVVEHPSATDLVGLVSNRLDGEASRATLAYADAHKSGGTETDRQQAGVSTFVTASRQASFASQAGEAAGAVNATNSLPALMPSASPNLPEGRSLSRQHSGTCETRQASLTSSERESTWVSRATAKTEDLRAMFQLPEDENVMDDFLCALQKKLLLQGRMYVFEHYVCFHSNVFGYVKNKIIPLEDVTAVRKCKNLGFPNSIEISWGHGRREFFTSFLSREDAFRLVMAAWHQSAPDKAAAQMYSATSKGSKTGRRSASPRLECALSAARNGGAESFTVAHGSAQSDGFLAKSASLLMRPVAHVQRRASERTVMRHQSLDPAQLRGAAEGNGTGAKASERPDPRRVSLATTAERSGSWHESQESEDGERRSADNDSDDGESTTAEAITDAWAPSASQPPPLAPGMQLLVEGELRGITMQDLCEHILSDESNFYIEFHHQRGDEQASISKWRHHHPLGRVRELQFVTALKSRIGPPKTMCYQTQRYAMYAENQLVFETSQVMPDIPYGDCFTVEARWDIQPQPQSPGAPPALSVTTHVMVDFAKSTIWRKAIESGVIGSCRSAHEQWLAAAQRTVDAGFSGQAAESKEQDGAAPATPPRAGGASPAASVQGVTPNLGAPPGSPAHLAGLMEMLPREHRAAVGRLLRGEDPVPSPSPSGARRRLSTGSQRGGGGGAARLLTPRQWVLLGLAVAVIGLQLVILWRFAAIAGAAPAAAAQGLAAQPPPMAPVSSRLDSGGGGELSPGDGDSWAARMHLLVEEVGTMRRRLDLLATDVSAAISSAPAECSAEGG